MGFVDVKVSSEVDTSQWLPMSAISHLIDLEWFELITTHDCVVFYQVISDTFRDRCCSHVSNHPCCISVNNTFCENMS